MFDIMNYPPCIQDHIRVGLSTKHKGASEHGVLSDYESDHGDMFSTLPQVFNSYPLLQL